MSINKKVILFIIIGCLLTVLFSLFITNYIENTQPYKVALKYIKNNDKIKAITGGVKGIGMLGRSFELEQTTNPKNRKATLLLPIKGKDKDISVTICLLQDTTNNWVVAEVFFW